MKKLLIAVLTLALCLAMLAGCANQAEVEETENSENTEEAEGVLVSPLPAAIDMENLDNCTVAVSLEEGGAYVDDTGKMQMDVTVYVYDLYDMVDIANLKAGDRIVRYDEEVEVTEISRNENGLVSINGGEEKGGFDLISNDNTVYYEVGFSDVKAYYSLGEATIPVSPDFVYLDTSDLENPEGTEYYPGDFLTEDGGIVYGFTPNNTQITIQDGNIIKMEKFYTP